MILDPIAAYAIKTVDVANGEKFFINVCTDQQINPPDTLDASEVAMQALKGQDWVVPIVVSSLRRDTDKAGQECNVADCCMNPSVVLLGIEDPSVKVLTVETCIELVEDRFNVQLSREYKFPRLKSKGKLEKFEVKDTEDALDEPLIENKPTKKPEAKPKIGIEVLDSKTTDFYFHVYKGNYTKNGKKPSHLVEIDGETHSIKIKGSILFNGTDQLNLNFTPSMAEGFYSTEDGTTYVMLWS